MTKVNKNVTFDYEHFKLILRIQEEHKTQTFSGALRKALEQLIQLSYLRERMQKELMDANEELEKWKSRAENKAGKNSTATIVIDANKNTDTVVASGTSTKNTRKQKGAD